MCLLNDSEEVSPGEQSPALSWSKAFIKATITCVARARLFAQRKLLVGAFFSESTQAGSQIGIISEIILKLRSGRGFREPDLNYTQSHVFPSTFISEKLISELYPNSSALLRFTESVACHRR